MKGPWLDTKLRVEVGSAPQRLGRSLAAERVDRQHVIGFSVVSIWEMAIWALDAGVREGEERQRLDAFVAAFEVLTLDRQPAQRVGPSAPGSGAISRCRRRCWCPTPRAELGRAPPPPSPVPPSL